uniref:Uncharacterized protein n=1 Tax=Ananas comosus var. bracteatus TaxID=296719 RepID=A0A6V7PUU3_ANACO|nr:unnamed protein product [Ananas comosus var. bracteatus]
MPNPSLGLAGKLPKSMAVPPLPTSSSVPTSEKRPMESAHSTPLPPPKRRKSVAKRPHPKQTEGLSSVDVLKKRAEDISSANVPEKIAEETHSADVSKQDSVPNEPIEVESSPENNSRVCFASSLETQISRQLRREVRLKKKKEAERKRAAQEMSKDLPTSDAAPPLSSPIPTTERENVSTPLEEGVERASTVPHSTPEASSSAPEDPLPVILHSLLVSSPNSNEGDDLSTIVMSTDTQQKFDKCLHIYSRGLPYLAQNPEQFDRLCALLFDLADQPDVSSAGKCFVDTLSSQFSSFLSRQQSLGAELLSSDQHFYQVDHFKKAIPEIAAPITDTSREDHLLENQESALRQRISTLKEELAATELTLARTSERRLQLQNQLKARMDEGMKLQEKLSQLYKVHPLMKRRRKTAKTAEANLTAEWNQLRDLLFLFGL